MNKEELILNYINDVNWKGDWSYKKIEEELNNILGTKSRIDIKYKKDVLLNEDSSKSEEIKAVGGITIYYNNGIDSNNLPITEKVEIKL